MESLYSIVFAITRNNMFKLFKFKEKNYYDFMKIHKIFFVISLCAIFISIGSFFINKLNFGVDFTGGLLFDVSVKDNSDIAKLRNDFLKHNFNDFNVQSYGDGGFIIRVSEQEVSKQAEKELSNSESIQLVKNLINSSFNDEVKYNKIDFVGPQVGKELILKGLIALILSFAVMLTYIAIRFKLEFGIGAIIALAHDAILTFGIYSIFKMDFDLTAIAAVLTVIGYSVNDKVVIYDRIREFLPKYKNESLTEVINRSLTTTLRRTLLTSSTTLISLLILALIGGEALKNFSIIVFLGIIIGTYSSIFISTPILIYLGNDKKKLLEN